MELWHCTVCKVCGLVKYSPPQRVHIFVNQEAYLEQQLHFISRFDKFPLQLYSPQLDSPPPKWVNFAHRLLLFLYQTFDAVDGKQSRRTNSSSPLGELFDLGCDALACAVVLARKGNMLLALAMLYPFVMLLVGTLMWDYISPIDLMGNYPHLLVVGTGLAFGFLVSLFYMPFAIANALTARLNDRGVVILIGR